MVAKLRAFSLPILLAFGAVAAQDLQEAPPAPQFPTGRNHVYLQPFLTAVSLASEKIPLFLTLTYERLLASPGNAFIWQPQLFLGDATIKDVTVTQYTTAQFLGLRHYFGAGYRGFYLQGSAAGMIGSLKAEKKGEPNKAKGSGTGFGAFAYAGYKWDFVFLDIGGGYRGSNATLEFDSGEEVEGADSGPGIDFNLGIGF